MQQQLFLALLVGIGGGTGSICRYGVSLAMQRFMLTWPAATLTANVIGCFVIGIVTTFAGRGGVAPEVRLALATGFCGGFTTMSSMIYETASMARTGGYAGAALYVGATLLLSAAAFFAAGTAVRLFFR